MRAGVADGERQFRRRARRLKQAGVATILRGNARSQLGEIPREMPCVVSDGDLRTPCALRLRKPFPQVGHESLRRAADVVKIHRVRAGTRELRPAERIRRPAFRRGNNFSNRSSSQTTGAESERAKKPVIEFSPFPSRHELADGGRINRGTAALKKLDDVPGAALEQLPRYDRAVYLRLNIAHEPRSLKT